MCPYRIKLRFLKKDAVKNKKTLAPADLPPPKWECCSAGGGYVADATTFHGMWECWVRGGSVFVLPPWAGWNHGKRAKNAKTFHGMWECCRSWGCGIVRKEERMKRNKKVKFEVKGPEGIEDGLMGMGRAIEAGGPWTHPEMERIVLQSRESRTVEERAELS